MDVSARGILELARQRFANRDYYGALLSLEDLAGDGRDYADLHHLRGLCFALLDRPDDALVEFDRALALNPRYLEALLHRGLTLNQLGRSADAAESFAAAAAAEGPPVAGLTAPVAARLANEHARLGDLYAEAHALNAAIGEYRRATELGPNFHDLRVRLARLLLEAGNPLQAREELGVVLAARPDNIEARVQLGMARYLAGDTAGARDTWRMCRQVRPDVERVSAYLAMVERIPE
ncbi:MAG: tetratricopeptide repeat protein [Gemmatimonadales bacterium]